MKRISIVFLLCLVFFSSCITLKEPQVKTINNVDATGILSAHPKITFDVIVYNPNSIGLTITDFKLNVLMGKKSLADITNARPYNVEPESDATVPMVIEPTADQLSLWLQASLSGLGQTDQEKFNGVGSLKVRKFLFSKTIHFRF
jgi:LEA14-like dessication related protein